VPAEPADVCARTRWIELTVTFSVVARDPATGELGIAVSSCVLAVGRAVPWATAGIGVAATQSHTRRGYGPHGLAGLQAGLGPDEVLDTLLSRDADAQSRQVALLGADGRVAAHTGAECLPACGHRVGEGYSVQGNMLASESVLDAMAEGFAYTAAPLAERLLAGLEAGERAGGDLRGRQSAAILVVGPEVLAEPWEAVPIDLRVDDSDDPLASLGRLLKLQRAYEHSDTDALAELAPDGPRDLHAALGAARRGDLSGAKQALSDLRRRPGWDAWLRTNATAGRLPHLAELLD
jgi:uncharacterized Ntn-hydrolase superfamily protein